MLSHKNPPGATLRLGDQIGCGQCSGVLIGPNRVATAGHCVNANSCASKRIIFNATNINGEDGNGLLCPLCVALSAGGRFVLG